MRRNHRFFEREREGKPENEASYKLGRQNLEHRDIIHARRVVEHEDERNEKCVGKNGRYGGKQGLSAQ